MLTLKGHCVVFERDFFQSEDKKTNQINQRSLFS